MVLPSVASMFEFNYPTAVFNRNDEEFIKEGTMLTKEVDELGNVMLERFGLRFPFQMNMLHLVDRFKIYNSIWSVEYNDDGEIYEFDIEFSQNSFIVGLFEHEQYCCGQSCDDYYCAVNGVTIDVLPGLVPYHLDLLIGNMMIRGDQTPHFQPLQLNPVGIE